MGWKRPVLAGLAGFTVIAAAAPAVAQVQDPPKVAVSVAAGVANPFHGDFNFTAPEWQIAARIGVSPHFVVEGFFDQWRHSSETVFVDVPLEDRTGVVGRVGRISDRRLDVTQVVGVNALARATAGRVTFTGGGGPGLITLDRTFTQILTDCQSAVLELCQNRETGRTSSGFSVQGVAGVDVALSPRWMAFGQYQLTLLVEDPGSSHSSVTGGVRFVIR